MDRNDLELYLNNLLQTPRFRDYCPNGLQVQGRRRIEKIATGVTASLAFVEAAIEWGADALFVHHGYFWRNEPAPIVGQKHGRLRALLVNDINLFAYHLPLDSHPELGNNVQLAERLGWIPDGRFGENDMGWLTTLPMPMTLEGLAAQVNNTLGRLPLVIGDDERPIRRIAWCTGAAQGYFDEAVAAGADVYLSGEISESTTHLARESGVAYIAAGHHATERYGVQAVGSHLADQFDIEHLFIDIDNPV
ncbi:GTP cyclohydrolase 1 type 2 homolog [Pararobbsia alpina]|uniref:Nif3-like dinuclear metal center hexameric protein n=1 Tax=Pararobbsia alpina TaxID=621374 RepID=UPI0039A642C4